MKLFRHWARASVELDAGWTLVRYAGSDMSLDDAQRRADALVRATADRLGGQAPRGGLTRDALDLDRYHYGDRPAREEIVKTSDDGGATWAITRNSYGALVLNTAGALFADIDDPARISGSSGSRGGGLLGRLFGRRMSPAEALTAHLDAHGLGGRLYRTAAGYRLLVTNRTFDPVAANTETFLRDVGSDPLYVALCRAQESFRARVSPKYWRCDAIRPPSRYPWADAGDEHAYRAWEAAYHEKADTHATCELVAELGVTGVSDAIAPALEMHDSLACLPGATLA